MRSYVTLAQVSSVCLRFHPWSSACALVLECPLHPSLYFFLKSFFHLFLNPAMVPDENSMEDPLCNSSFGSMVSLDYVTPDTENELEADQRRIFPRCFRVLWWRCGKQNAWNVKKGRSCPSNNILPILGQRWLLTADPLIGVSVIFAKFSQ